MLTWKEHRKQLAEYVSARDREYLEALIRVYTSPSLIAESVGINRTLFYRLCKKRGVEMPQSRGNEEGNEEWRALGY